MGGGRWEAGSGRWEVGSGKWEVGPTVYNNTLHSTNTTIKATNTDPNSHFPELASLNPDPWLVGRPTSHLAHLNPDPWLAGRLPATSPISTPATGWLVDQPARGLTPQLALWIAFASTAFASTAFASTASNSTASGGLLRVWRGW